MNPYGGGNRVRTDDPLLAGQVLYQLSYTPKCIHKNLLRKFFVRLVVVKTLNNRNQFDFAFSAVINFKLAVEQACLEKF